MSKRCIYSVEGRVDRKWATICFVPKLVVARKLAKDSANETIPHAYRGVRIVRWKRDGVVT